MNPILKTLEHLSYVIECAALSYFGEAKTELYFLCKKLEEDGEYSFSGKEQVAIELRMALECYGNGEMMTAASGLSQVSRMLWRTLERGVCD